MEIKKVLCFEFIWFLGSLYLTSGEYRIIGGSNAKIEDNPWDISITSSGKHYCGGVILSPNIVLTAAHCLWTKTIDDELAILAGTTDLSDLTKAQRIEFSVNDSVIHENYDQETIDYDICIIKLKKDLEYSSRVKNVQLPYDGFEIPVDTPVTISGWGVVNTTTHNLPQILQSATIYNEERNLCHKTLESIAPFTERMICAGVPSGQQDTCQGDSGGGVVVNETVIGIVSWGHGCGIKGYPAVYTNVTYFLPWIRKLADL